MNQEKIDEKASEIKMENRKYLPRFILIFAACMVAGFICGWLIAWGQGASPVLDYMEWLSKRSGYLIAFLIAVIDVIVLLRYIPLTARTHKSVLAWDGEDEERAAKIERNLLNGVNDITGR